MRGYAAFLIHELRGERISQKKFRRRYQFDQKRARRSGGKIRYVAV
jgi:hypothetical protein